MDKTLSLILCLGLPCLMTTLGALLIFFFKKPSKALNVVTIGLASGIMLSASIWSLLVPSLEYAENSMQKLAFLPVSIGFLLGGIFMLVLDMISARVTKHNSQNQKAFKLFAAITIHNIPEGLSVGFAVGSAATSSNFLTAAIFAIGIALQNFPEGLATALPINNCIKNHQKSFWLAFLSGTVEPVFAALGLLLATKLTNLLPWLLSFSAGAMIYVIMEELLPEIHESEKITLGTWAFFIGFVIMMLLDICL